MKSAFTVRAIQLASQLTLKDLPDMDPMWNFSWQVQLPLVSVHYIAEMEISMSITQASANIATDTRATRAITGVDHET